MTNQLSVSDMHSKAQEIRSMGRDNDTVLIHMTPKEVGGLQALARVSGGSLTVNPHTGLPEAGFLDSVLPMLLGGVLSLIPGVGPLAAAGLVGLGTGAITGDLSKGLMAGLGAFGGASLGGALGAGGLFGGAEGAASAAATAGTDAATQAAAQAAQAGAHTAAGGLSGLQGAATGLNAIAPAQAGTFAQAFAPLQAGTTGMQHLASGLGSTLASGGSQALAPLAEQAAEKGFFGKFADAAAIKGLPKAATTTLAGMGLLNGVSEAMNPDLKTYEEDDGFEYGGPYKQVKRTPNFRSLEDMLSDTSEHLYFDKVNPIPGIEPITPSTPSGGEGGNSVSPFLARLLSGGEQDEDTLYTDYKSRRGYANGGLVSVNPGSFVVNAPAVSALGNGSSNAGQERLAAMGGMPLRGPGDGRSDSIPGMIKSPHGVEPARFARDEVVMPPDAVRKFGGGNHSLGAQRLYDMMHRIVPQRPMPPMRPQMGLAPGGLGAL